MSFFRKPKTKNEMWQYYATTENDMGIKIKVRGRRSPKPLPNAWDDFEKHSSRSWKKYRKTQYKV